MIYLMVGIPGAGKTTYAKNVLGHADYFGTDKIRKELFGKELTLRGRKRVYEMLYRKVNEALQNVCDVLISYPSDGIEKQQEKRAACAGNWNCANVFSAHPSTG